MTSTENSTRIARIPVDGRPMILSEVNRAWGRYLVHPEDYNAMAITHEDAQQDNQVRALDEVFRIVPSSDRADFDAAGGPNWFVDEADAIRAAESLDETMPVENDGTWLVVTA